MIMDTIITQTNEIKQLSQLTKEMCILIEWLVILFKR